MAYDMMRQLEMELAKRDQRRKVDKPWWADVAAETIRNIPVQQQRAAEWKERKSAQMVGVMEEITKDYESTTNIDSLNLMGERLQGYIDKNKSRMNVEAVDLSNVMQQRLSDRSEKIVNLNTDIEMLDASKQQWLGYADAIVDQPLGAEDYTDLSTSISQFVKMKDNMVNAHADLLALPQYQHVVKEMGGLDSLVKEMTKDAKDQNIFTEKEHERFTGAIDNSDYSIVAEMQAERIAAKGKDMTDFLESDGGLLQKMDLYRRLGRMKKGEKVLLPEVFNDAETMYSLSDLGLKNINGNYEVDNELSNRQLQEFAPLQDNFLKLAGVGGNMGQAEADVKRLDKLHETKFGDKYTSNKFGFEDLYNSEDKSSLESDIEADDDLISVTDDDGFIDIDKAVDEFGWGEVAAITTAVGVHQHKRVMKGAKSSIKFMKEVAHLSEDRVATMLQDSDVEKFVKQLRLKGEQLKKIDRVKDPKKYQKLLAQRKQIIDKAYNILGIRYATDEVQTLDEAKKALKLAEKSKDANAIGKARVALNKADDAVKMHKKGMLSLLQQTNKWDLWKMKSGLGIRQAGRTAKDLAKIGGKTFGKLTPLDAAVWGWMIGDKWGLNNYGKAAVAGGTYYSAKQVMNMVSKKGGIMKAMMNPTLQSKIGKYLVKKAPKLAAKMGIKLAAGGASQAVPFIGQAFGTAMLAWTAKDLYNLISDIPELTEYVMEWGRGEYDEDLGKPQVLPKF